MDMTKGKIVTLVLVNGAEIVGRHVQRTPDGVTLNRPRMVQATPQGVGLVNGISMTGIEPKGDFTFPTNSIMYTIDTVEEIANGWTSQTSGLALPQKGLLS